jgi:catalase
VRPSDIARSLGLLAKVSSRYVSTLPGSRFIGVNLVEAVLPITQLQFAGENGGDTVVSSYGVVTAQAYTISSATADITLSKDDKGFISDFVYEISQHRCWAREMDGLTSRVAF